jgi:transitional endoplasmic reticulum ATPase
MSTETKAPMKTFKDVAVIRSTEHKIVLPEAMTFTQAAEWCMKMEERDQQPISIQETIDAYPLDGALAFMKALQRTYGWTDLRPTPSFFGPQPPKMISVKINALGETVQVPWGKIAIPGVDGSLQTGVAIVEKQPKFQIGGTVRQKHASAVAAIAALTRQIVKEESIYRGQALRMSFEGQDIEAESFNPFNGVPEFIDLADVQASELIFSQEIEKLVEATVFEFVEDFTFVTQTLRVPKKRGVLLEGPYGTGKTLTALVTAQKAVRHGWTFIYLTATEKLGEALRFAKQYGKTVIFAEDIDRVASERDDQLNELINTLDGVEFKDLEVLAVLTTNHVEKIHKSLLRNGRLDVVIPVRPPDARACERVVRLYGRNLIAASEDLTEVGQLLAGSIPAVIREVVERAKLYSAARTASAGATRQILLTAEDLKFAAAGMVAHMQLLAADDQETNRLEKAAAELGKALLKGIPQSQQTE